MILLVKLRLIEVSKDSGHREFVTNRPQNTVLTRTRVSGMDLETQLRQTAGIVLFPELEECQE